MSSLLRALWSHLSARRRRQFWLVLAMMPVSAMAEVVTLGAVIPFLGVLIAPDRALRNPVVAWLAHAIGVTTADRLVLPLTIGFVGAAVLSGAIRTFILWSSTRLAVAIGADISLEVYRRTLYQPYSVHVLRNSSEIISGITDKVNGVVFGVVLPLLTLISSAAVVVTITLTLIAINPIVAFATTVCFGGAYAIITWSARRRLMRNSRQVAVEHMFVVKALQEGLGGIRDVLLDGAQNFYSGIYRRADLPLRRAQGNNSFVGASPRYAMESLGMVMIAVLAFVLSRQAGGIASAIPVLGALAIGAQRLLPALQQSYLTWANITGTHGSLAAIITLLDQHVAPEMSAPPPAPLAFRDSICLRDVNFRYTPDGPLVLEGVNLTIPKGARIGFIGTTGSGKSTLMDVLMGLLLPTTGQLLVDDSPVVNANVRAWQRTIAHVPQSIYLADATMAENIAFGVPRTDIDLERVKRAARQAQISDYIESRPDQYDSMAGERGVRLSGGQRQRIGIARALYKQASVLVFDEATSALDAATEQSVMEAIEGLDRDLTVLIIAHRLSTIQRCDTIIQVEHGRLRTRRAGDAIEPALVSSPS